MKLYNNPIVTLAYLLGICGKNANAKINDAIEKRDERKTAESWNDYASQTEDEKKRRNQMAECIEKWAVRSLVICLIGLPCGFILLFFSSPVALGLCILDFSICIVAVLYGLWYTLWGKYI